MFFIPWTRDSGHQHDQHISPRQELCNEFENSFVELSARVGVVSGTRSCESDDAASLNLLEELLHLHSWHAAQVSIFSPHGSGSAADHEHVNMKKYTSKSSYVP